MPKGRPRYAKGIALTLHPRQAAKSCILVSSILMGTKKDFSNLFQSSGKGEGDQEILK